MKNDLGVDVLEEFYELIGKLKEISYGNQNTQIFTLTICLLILIRLFSRILSSGNIVFFLVNLPGTIVHELSHFIVGLILIGKPVKFTVIPKKTENGYIMGSVSFTNITTINALPIGLAPLTLLPIVFFGSKYSLEYLGSLNYENSKMYIPILLGITIYSIFISCLPSSADYKIVFSKKIGLILYLLLMLFLVDRYLIRLDILHLYIEKLFKFFK